MRLYYAYQHTVSARFEVDHIYAYVGARFEHPTGIAEKQRLLFNRLNPGSDRPQTHGGTQSDPYQRSL
jgi:hypothetical protein